MFKSLHKISRYDSYYDISIHKHTKNKEAAAKSAPMGKGGPQTLMAAGFVAEYSKLSNNLINQKYDW